MQLHKQKALTLVEVLVTITILALLFAVSAPALRRARMQVNRIACASNLRQIGIGLVAYLATNRALLPHSSLLPSLDPFPVTLEQPIYFSAVVGSELSDESSAVFRCPSDRPGSTRRDEPNTEKSYYETERSSYEYRSRMAGYTMQVLINVFRRWVDASAAENTLWLVRDYDNFHGKAGASGSRNYLYIDGHVSGFEKH